MSAASGGQACTNAGPVANAARSVPGIATKSNVCRKKDFELICAQPVELKDVVNAVVSLVQPPQLLEGLQQINSRKYIVSFKSAAGAELFIGLAPLLRIPGTDVSCKWLGAEFKKIKVAFLPLAVPNEELAAALGKYGRVLQISEELHQFTSIPLKTGTRFVDMEMAIPVPNMISVHGYTVPATYKGVVIQCRRCLQTGHIKSDCNVPHCDRCRTFGHTEDVCFAPCLKCKSPEHHWRDCTVRSYAFAMASSAGNRSAADVVGGEPVASAELERCATGRVALVEQPDMGQQSTVGDVATANANHESAVVADPAESKMDAVPSSAGVVRAAANEYTTPVKHAADDVQVATADAVVTVDAGTSCVQRTNVAAPTEISKPDVEWADTAMDEFASQADNGRANAKDHPNHLEWKRAITRSKRKLMAVTPGTSPLIKKALNGKTPQR